MSPTSPGHRRPSRRASVWPWLAASVLAAFWVGSQTLPAPEDSRPQPLELPTPIAWEARFQGVDYAALELTAPRPLRGHMVRIDLTAPGVGFVTTPGNGDRPGETDSLKTSSFLEKTGCQVAVNANPFSPVTSFEGKPLEVRGLLVGDGGVVSPGGDPLPAVLIRRGNKASISKPPFELEGVRYAVGGFSVVLKDGKNVGAHDPRHPRTAAGISADGRYLYLVVIDGRQSGYSEGVTTFEVGAWLEQIGAAEGINLDGGGTSTLVMSRADGKPAVINRPIHMGVPGLERPSGGHLGVRAAPLRTERADDREVERQPPPGAPNGRP